MWARILAIALLHTLCTPTLAQTTNTTCRSNPTTSFLFNRNNESPCLAWAKLQSLCVPETAFINVPPLVNRTYGYNAPGMGGTACQCNIVAYNLMAGCSWCQIGSGGSWASQWAYAQGCRDFKIDSLGFSQDSVMIPSFAWRDWDTARFDPDLAAAAAPSFATTSPPAGPTTLSRNFASSTAPPLTSSSQGLTISRSNTVGPDPTNTDQSRNDEGTPMGVVIGAIAGAVGAVVLITMTVFLFILRRRRKRAAHPAQVQEKDDGQGNGKRSSRRFDPNYHSSTDWKQKHRSFLDMLTPTPKGDGGFPSKDKGGKGGTKPLSELFADPKSFFSPRTAPLPFGAEAGNINASRDSLDTLRYTTTSERLKGRDRTESFSSGSTLSFGVGPPKVMAYTKAKHGASPQPPTAPVSVGNGTESIMSNTTTQYGAPPAGQADLLRAVNDMREQEVRAENKDDPLETPTPIRDYDKHTSYPFPRVATPPFPVVATTPPAAGPSSPRSPAPDTAKALPAPPSSIKTRISTKIPDSRFSSSAITLPQPPITPAHDFTLPPEEYRRKQTRHYSGPKTMYDEDNKSVVLPSLYSPMSGATRFSLSQRTDKAKSMAPSAARSSGIWTIPNSPAKRSSASAGESDGESIIFSATPSTDSRYPSFIPDAQTVARVKAAFGGSTAPLRFPLPPSRSGSKDPEHEWEKAKSKEKLSHEVKKIGRKGPIQERGNENSLRRGGG